MSRGKKDKMSTKRKPEAWEPQPPPKRCFWVVVDERWDLHSEDFAPRDFLVVDPTRLPDDGELIFLRVGANAIHIGRYFTPSGRRKTAAFLPITPGVDGPVKKINLTELYIYAAAGKFRFEMFPITEKIHFYKAFGKQLSIRSAILKKGYPLKTRREAA